MTVVLAVENFSAALIAYDARGVSRGGNGAVVHAAVDNEIFARSAADHAAEISSGGVERSVVYAVDDLLRGTTDYAARIKRARTCIRNRSVVYAVIYSSVCAKAVARYTAEPVVAAANRAVVFAVVYYPRIRLTRDAARVLGARYRAVIYAVGERDAVRADYAADNVSERSVDGAVVRAVGGTRQTVPYLMPQQCRRHIVHHLLTGIEFLSW